MTTSHSKSEKLIQTEVLLHENSKDGSRLWRNNVGQARLPNGSIIRYGLCVGSSDAVGIETITITPDMVGKKVGVFKALEFKTKTGKASILQKDFIKLVKRLGGIAGIVRSTEDADKLIKRWNTDE